MLRILLLAFVLSPLLSAESRVWHSADGKRSLKAEFVSRNENSVTVRRNGFDEVVIPFEKLHPDDLNWLDSRHPLPPPDPPPVFDTLRFGDSRQTVVEKLDSSSLVKTDAPKPCSDASDSTASIKPVRKSPA